MKIKCLHCQKDYDIPDERFSKLGEYVKFPCPSCKGIIEIDVRSAKMASAKQSVPPSEGKPTGEALKKRILRTVSDLQPMPQVAQKARKVVADGRSSFADLAKVIETDQAIATRVLKMANSPYYGTGSRVTSIRGASVVLGMKTLNELLTLACADSVLGSELKGYGLASGDLWKHSLAVASCAKSIAGKTNPDLADDAFSAGLIHDCGKLILDQYLLKRSEEFNDFMGEGGKTFLEAEKRILGFDHPEMGAEVCDKWQIPKTLTNAIKYHHYPKGGSGDDLSYIVHAADAIALMSGIASGIDGMMYSIDEDVAEILKLDRTAFSLLMAEMAEYVEKTISGI